MKSRVVAKPAQPVPLLDLQRQYQPLREQILAAIERVCSSQHFVLGAEVEALEREIAAYTGAHAAVGCGSGTDALWLALLAADVQPGDTVITTAFSFFASASAIARIGARPAFVDIDPRTFNLDPASVERELRTQSKVKAILPVHLYGQCADMDSLCRLAEQFKAVIVEDAAQAIGAAWGAARAGAIGSAAAFSFYPTKNLSAFGEAGMVTARDPQLAEHMRRLRTHGSPQRYLHEEFGWNARMDAIQAAVLRVKLPQIGLWNQKRREHAATYQQLFQEAGLVGGNAPVTLPQVSAKAHHIFHQFVIRVRRRNDLRQFLSEREISTEVYYPIPLHLQPVFAYLGYREGDLPEAERAAQEVLAIPMFPELTEEELRWVVQSIADFYS